MLCELCGAEVPRTRDVAIEGTVLSVCGNCAKFGDAVMASSVRRTTMPPLISERLDARKRRLTPRDVYAEAGPEELTEDFAERIRRARESRGWRQADLGAKINEKASVIAKLESGTMTPNDALVRKLEKELGIKLKERLQPVAGKAQAASQAMTLGDFINMQERAP